MHWTDLVGILATDICYWTAIEESRECDEVSKMTRLVEQLHLHFYWDLHVE